MLTNDQFKLYWLTELAKVSWSNFSGMKVVKWLKITPNWAHRLGQVTAPFFKQYPGVSTMMKLLFGQN